MKSISILMLSLIPCQILTAADDSTKHLTQLEKYQEVRERTEIARRVFRSLDAEIWGDQTTNLQYALACLICTHELSVAATAHNLEQQKDFNPALHERIFNGKSLPTANSAYDPECKQTKDFNEILDQLLVNKTPQLGADEREEFGRSLF